MIFCGCCGCCVLCVGCWPHPKTAVPRSPPPPQETPLPGPRPPPDRPKFRAFFALSRTILILFFPLLGVFSLNFGCVFEGRDTQMCTFGLSGLLCETPALPKVEIGQSSSRPSSLGLIERNGTFFVFPGFFHVGVFFPCVSGIDDFFSLEMPMEKEGPKRTW